MEPKQLLKRYLNEGRVLQLATVNDGQPWVCTVYYVVDPEMNIYWLSFPSWRHSQEIAKHNKIAITVPVKLDLPVIGIQAEGIASVITDPARVEMATNLYIKKYDAAKHFYKNFQAGINQHHMYQFTAASFVLFDEVHFPQNGRQEVTV